MFVNFYVDVQCYVNMTTSITNISEAFAVYTTIYYHHAYHMSIFRLIFDVMFKRLCQSDIKRHESKNCVQCML